MVLCNYCKRKEAVIFIQKIESNEDPKFSCEIDISEANLDIQTDLDLNFLFDKAVDKVLTRQFLNWEI